MSSIQQHHSVTSSTMLATRGRYLADDKAVNCVTSVSPDSFAYIYLSAVYYRDEYSVSRRNEYTFFVPLAETNYGNLLADFEEFMFPNWDNEGAFPITNETLAVARRILLELPLQYRSPEAAPGADGSVCMEWMWQPGNRKLFIDVGPQTKVLVYARLSEEERAEKMFPRFDLQAKNYTCAFFERLGSSCAAG